MGVARVLRGRRLRGVLLSFVSGARHSRNLAARPQVSIVIFDSHARIGMGQAVYVSAVAEELTISAHARPRIFMRHHNM
jgi:hypothetical protein